MNQPVPAWSPTRITATVIGVFFGLFSSINHGIFEVLQGSQPTGSLVFNAIGEAQRFWPEGTEPAFSIIPNLRVTGIFAILAGIAIIIWSIWFLPTRHGRTVYLGLFLFSFLVGGGIGQAFFFFPAWAFATRMGKPLTWWKKALPQPIRPVLARIYPVTLILATLSMLVGLEMAIFGYFPGMTDLEKLTNTNMTFVFSAVVLYVLAFIAGFGRELLKQDPVMPQELLAWPQI